MSLTLQNPQNDLCTQRWLRSAWASTQSDQSLLCTQWVAKYSRFLHAGSEGPDQTGWMPRLIWAFAGRTGHFVGFVMLRLSWLFLFMEHLYVACPPLCPQGASSSKSMISLHCFQELVLYVGLKCMTHKIESICMIINNALKLACVKGKIAWYIADLKDNVSDSTFSQFKNWIKCISKRKGRQSVNYHLGRVKRFCVFEHSVMTNFNCMPSHSEVPGIWLSVWRFLLTHCLYEQAAEVLARLRGCAGSPEPSLLT